MDSLSNQSRTAGSEVPVKAAEIQAVTHQSILGVGDTVFQKNNELQNVKFNTTLQAQQAKLMKRLNEEKDSALQDLSHEHKDNLDKLQDQYNEMMDKALKEEAQRLQAIMDKIAMASLEEEKLEGQRKLDESLKKARIDFDVEKAEAILQVTLEHEKAQKVREEELLADHEAECERLNAEWSEKMQILSEKAILHEKERLEYELEMAKQKFDKQMEEALLEADQKHQDVVTSLNEAIEKEKQDGAALHSKIDSLDATIETRKQELRHLLQTFQEFIDRTPGFSSGQSEFVLHQLLPSGFDEFISGGD